MLGETINEWMGTDQSGNVLSIASTYNGMISASILYADDSAVIQHGERLGELVLSANALLIEASPDLLAALEDAEFLLRQAGKYPGPMQDSFQRSAEDARAAIAKAKGAA